MLKGKDVQEGYGHAKTGGASQGAQFDVDELFLERLQHKVNI